jgi:hypothetical protein
MATEIRTRVCRANSATIRETYERASLQLKIKINLPR